MTIYNVMFQQSTKFEAPQTYPNLRTQVHINYITVFQSQLSTRTNSLTNQDYNLTNQEVLQL
jgi:hypothetical protein